MNYARRPGIDSVALQRLLARENESFLTTHRESARLASASTAHWLNGVPMHWMRDWNTPHPLFVRRARGVEVEDVDGNNYLDFCFGDTGAMFGHAPPPIARALAAAGAEGITAMLPAERVARVGEKLANVFGLPYWQMTQTASDANRAVLRWARAITGRARILCFDGCYHGTVDDTLVRALPERKGASRARAGLIGLSHDVSATTDAVPFNDAAALEQVLARGRTAAVIAEPVMTNIGMVLPAAGFLQKLRELTRRHGALLIIDETHTLSSARGGYSRAQNLEPDFWVCGKAIAGGMPCAVFGFTAEVEAGMQRVWRDRAGGHSGMGTTLSWQCTRARLPRSQPRRAHDASQLPGHAGHGELPVRRSRPAVRRACADLARGARRCAPGVRLRQSAARRRGIRARGLARARTCHPSLPAQPRRPAHTLPQHDAVLAADDQRTRRPAVGRLRDCLREIGSAA
jgi:glutamate-1-semialdehyde 2,1-aminomutase